MFWEVVRFAVERVYLVIVEDLVLGCFLRQFKSIVITLNKQKKMKKSKFTESQIIQILKKQDEGKKVAENWRKKQLHYLLFLYCHRVKRTEVQI